MLTRPLALHPNKLRPQIEDQVVPLTIRQRPKDTHTKSESRIGDRKFRYSTLLIGREHDRQSSLRIGQR